MKKFTWILASALLLFPLTANASVSTKVDSGVTTHISQTRTNPWSSFELRKENDQSLPTVTLKLTDYTPYFFSNNTQLITDGAVSDLKLLDTYRNQTQFKSLVNSIGTYQLSSSQINAIKEAKNVSIRTVSYNNPTTTWKVSGKILKEWQEVLAKN